MKISRIYKCFVTAREKVMLLQVSVCPRGGGGCIPACTSAEGDTPETATEAGGTHPTGMYSYVNCCKLKFTDIV